jgi:hypothetical protein
MNRRAAAVVGIGSVAGILILLGQLALVRAAVPSLNPGTRSSPAAGAGSMPIPCSPLEQLAIHYHVALLIHREGRIDTLPAGTGIEPLCFYWLHVHDDSGIVHIEAPADYQDHVFVLADVFGVADLRLDRHHLGSATYGSGNVAVYVKGVKWAGVPGAVPLVDLDTIDVVAPGQRFVYAPFDWDPGFLPPPLN